MAGGVVCVAEFVCIFDKVIRRSHTSISLKFLYFITIHKLQILG